MTPASTIVASNGQAAGMVKVPVAVKSPVREESWVERVRVGGWMATRVDSGGHRDCYREQEAFGNCDKDDRK
jgi:hypothetical protein